MNWSITIRSEAEQDLRDARDWYDQQRQGLGNDFLLAATEAMLVLEESPMSQSNYYRDFRRILLDRFPYKVFYRVEGQAVIVFRVLHAARDHTRELD